MAQTQYRGTSSCHLRQMTTKSTLLSRACQQAAVGRGSSCSRSCASCCPTSSARASRHCRQKSFISSMSVSSSVALGDLADDMTLLDIGMGPAGFNPVLLVLPLGAVVAGVALLRLYLYSQLEYITASMLSKYVPTGEGGARVIQLGGGTRELFYYPKDCQLVINVGEKVNKSLMEQAGVQATVPTTARQQPVTDLRFQQPGSIDAVVALPGSLAGLNAAGRAACISEVLRVLKPGRPLVFVERVEEGGSPLRALLGGTGPGVLSVAALNSLQETSGFSYVQWDVALAGQDPHAAGVAVKGDADDGFRERKAPAAVPRNKDRGFRK